MLDKKFTPKENAQHCVARMKELKTYYEKCRKEATFTKWACLTVSYMKICEAIHEVEDDLEKGRFRDG